MCPPKFIVDTIIPGNDTAIQCEPAGRLPHLRHFQPFLPPHPSQHTRRHIKKRHCTSVQWRLNPYVTSDQLQVRLLLTFFNPGSQLIRTNTVVLFERLMNPRIGWQVVQIVFRLNG